MDQNDDNKSNMDDEALSDQIIEQLLQGKVDPLIASGAVAYLANLIEAAKVGATDNELAQEAIILSRFKEALGQGGVRRITHPNERKAHTSFLAARTLGALIAASVLTGTAVAAYHGELPGNVQNSLSTSLAKVGVSLPTSNSSTSDSTSSSISLPIGKSPSNLRAGANSEVSGGTNEGLAGGSSLYGICTAYTNSQGSSNTTTTSASTTTSLAGNTSTTSPNAAGSGFTGSVEYRQLQTAAQQKGETIPQLCANVGNPSQPSDSTTSTVMQASQHASEHANSHANMHAAFYNSTTSTTSTTFSSSLTVRGNHGNSPFDRAFSAGRFSLSGSEGLYGSH